MKKVLIINPFGIGDCLFTTPVIASIKDRFHGVFVGYWSNLRVKEILEDNPKIDRVFALSRGDLKKLFFKSKKQGFKALIHLWREIREEGFDVALDYSLDHRYGLFCKLAGINKRIGFNYKGRGRFLTKKVLLLGYQSRHVVDYDLDLLRVEGIVPSRSNLEAGVSQVAKAEARKLLGEQGIQDQDPFLAVAPCAGTSWGEKGSLKHWPAQNYAKLIDSLINSFQLKVVILGDSAEARQVQAIIHKLHQKPVNLVGKTSQKVLSAIIQRSKLLVTNDGGPLHIAVALGTKTVSFFGPTDPFVYGPYPMNRSRHIVLKAGIECSPCYNKFSLDQCKRNKNCLKKITPQMALVAIELLLKSPLKVE